MSRARREQNRKHPQPPPIPQAERRPVGRPVTPLIEVNEASLGAAMLALNPAMRAFVVAKVSLGLSNAAAAKASGYSARSPHAADVHGSRLAHDQRIQDAILEEGQKLMRSEGPKSVHVLVAIRDDKNAANKDRLSAAKELLDRSGFHATTEHKVTVEHLTPEQKDQRILMMAAELGLSQSEAMKLLVGPADAKVIEATYENVQDAFFEEAPTPEEQAATEKRERETSLRRQRRNMTPEELAAHKARKLEEKRAAAKAKFAEAQPPHDPNDLSDLF